VISIGSAADGFIGDPSMGFPQFRVAAAPEPETDLMLNLPNIGPELFVLWIWIIVEAFCIFQCKYLLEIVIFLTESYLSQSPTDIKALLTRGPVPCRETLGVFEESLKALIFKSIDGGRDAITFVIRKKGHLWLKTTGAVFLEM
jgi:hypothetical protein